MSLEALNSRISYVAQDQYLFNTSLLENIRLGRLTATDEEVIEAAKKAQCMEFIEKLPQGIRKGKVLRAVQGSQGRTAQTENRETECCVLFPGGRTDATGEIKECAYDQSEKRPGVPVPDPSTDR